LSGKQADLAGDDLEMLKKLSTAYQAVRTELGKVIVGQNEVIEQGLDWPRRCWSARWPGH